MLVGVQKMIKLNKMKYIGGHAYTYYTDFTTTGRWKTVKKGNDCKLYIEITEQKDISKWYQLKNIQPINRWVSEHKFSEIDPTVEIINECN